jgi:tetratricopeptide (TPR) repeat protein
MSSSAQDIDQLPAQTLRKLDRICTRFEAEWQSGAAPRLEQFLSDVGEPLSGVLLIELLRVEFDCRQRRGERPSPRDYLSRFPDRSGLVAQAWDAHQRSSAAGFTRSAALTVEPGASIDDLAEAPLPDVDGYDVQRRIGRGGMAVVYLARDRRLGRLVALKLISSAQPGAQLVARLRTEAQAVARLQHPNIVQIYEIGEHESQPYLALEFVNGGSLNEWIAGNPRPANEAARLVETIARAIHAAHRQGIVHRDLKPANVMLHKNGAVVPKVTDFGLAKFLDTDVSLTQSGVVVGTASYMSPEQASAAAGDVGPATDIYALGAILYELITGRPPFKAASVIETARLVRETEPVWPRQLQPQTPRDLETVCLKCLQKEPARRYATAEDLADDLARFLAGQPVRARPVGAVARAWRWARRNPLPASLILAIAISLVLGTVISSYLAWKNRALAQQERLARQDADAKRRAAETIAQYLHDAFRSPNPQRDGRSISVAEILDRAAARLEHDFADQPILRAELSYVIAESYLGLGLHTQAIPLLERAIEVLQSHLDHGDQRPIDAQSLLASVYRQAGQLDRAAALAEQTLARRRALLGDDDAKTVEAISNLAMIYQDSGKLDQSVVMHQQALDWARAHLGPQDVGRFALMNNLGHVYTLTGRVEQAIELFEAALAGFRQAHGRDHPQVLATMNNLANALAYAQQTDRAIEMFEQVLDSARRQLGEDHPHTLSTMGSLAKAYRFARRTAQAIDMATRALELARAKLGEDHPSTLNTAALLADTYSATSRYELAVPIYEQTLQGRRKTLGQDHPDTVLTMGGLANAYWRSGQPDRAEAVLRECILIRDRVAPEDWLTYRTRAQLGGLLMDSQRYSDAEPFLIQGYEGMAARMDRIPPVARAQVAEAGRKIISLYEAWGRQEDASAWRARLPAPASRPATSASGPSS